jgi:outer membrane biogenesis lipoprotein LolB
MKSILALLAAAALAGCAVKTLDGDLTVTIPAIDIDVRPEHRSRVHLTREWVERGTRYCRYSNGYVAQHHWRQECPRVY